MNGARYSETLRDKLKPAIRSERRGLLSEGDVLLPENACPHTAAHNAEALKKLNFEVLQHPLHSPDFAPSDYHLFGPIKQASRGRRSTKDQQPQETARARLVSQLRMFYSECIQKIVWR